MKISDYVCNWVDKPKCSLASTHMRNNENEMWLIDYCQKQNHVADQGQYFQVSLKPNWLLFYLLTKLDTKTLKKFFICAYYFNQINLCERNFFQIPRILSFYVKVCLMKSLKLLIRESYSRNSVLLF